MRGLAVTGGSSGAVPDSKEPLGHREPLFRATGRRSGEKLPRGNWPGREDEADAAFQPKRSPVDVHWGRVCHLVCNARDA